MATAASNLAILYGLAECDNSSVLATCTTSPRIDIVLGTVTVLIVYLALESHTAFSIKLSESKLVLICRLSLISGWQPLIHVHPSHVSFRKASFNPKARRISRLTGTSVLPSSGSPIFFQAIESSRLLSIQPSPYLLNQPLPTHSAIPLTNKPRGGMCRSFVISGDDPDSGNVLVKNFVERSMIDLAIMTRNCHTLPIV
jgi:hypothetical protein